LKKSIKKILKEYTIKKVIKEEVALEGINFKDLYKEMWDKMLYGVCMKYTNDINQAQDYCQNGFMKVYKNLGLFDGGGSLEGWVRRVINNNILDELRKRKIKYSEEEPKWGITDKDETEPQHFDEKHTEGISASDVIKLSSNLSPKYKEIFDLYYLDGYKHQEIAEKLGISVGTSKSNLYKAKANIKKYLQK